MSVVRSGLLCLLLPLSACNAPPPEPEPDPIERALDIQTEVLHQTREVIRYLEEEAKANAELRALPPSAPEPPAKQKQQGE